MPKVAVYPQPPTPLPSQASSAELSKRKGSTAKRLVRKQPRKVRFNLPRIKNPLKGPRFPRDNKEKVLLRALALGSCLIFTQRFLLGILRCSWIELHYLYQGFLAREGWLHGELLRVGAAPSLRHGRLEESEETRGLPNLEEEPSYGKSLPTRFPFNFLASSLYFNYIFLYLLLTLSFAFFILYMLSR